MSKKKIYVLIIVLLTSLSFAQDKFPNTLRYDEKAGSPKADLEVISWLAGHWQGEALGGTIEEIWAPPLDGSMMGAFKLAADDKVLFYEIEIIREVNETLICQLKHFGPDLKGWEEKDESEEFKLVKVSPNKIYFDEFTIERVSADEINFYVVITDKDVKKETRFNYRRVQ